MYAPSRGMVGYHGEFLTDTRGSGVMNRLFHSWAPWKGEIPGRRNGALISNDKGQSTAFALWNLEDRGQMFIADGEDVYEGMIIGENSRGEDLDVNPLKGKKLTNVRASGKDEAIRLTPPRRLTLEQAMAWIEDDELVEVTPAAIRLRKAYLDPNERKRQAARQGSGLTLPRLQRGDTAVEAVATPAKPRDSLNPARRIHMHAAPPLARRCATCAPRHRLRAGIANLAQLRPLRLAHLRAVAPELRQHRIGRRAPPQRTERSVVSVKGSVLRQQTG